MINNDDILIMINNDDILILINNDDFLILINNDDILILINNDNIFIINKHGSTIKYWDLRPTKILYVHQKQTINQPKQFCIIFVSLIQEILTYNL